MSDCLAQDLHPSSLVFGGVGIEVNNFAISKADAEALLDKHVSLLLFGEAGLSAGFAGSRHGGVDKRTPIVD